MISIPERTSIGVRNTVRGAARRMFSKLTFIGAQEQVYADRFVELGARRDCVEVTGSVKYDAAEIADRIDGQDALADEMGIDRSKPLWSLRDADLKKRPARVESALIFVPAA